MRQVFFQIQDFTNDNVIGYNGNVVSPMSAANFAYSNLGDFYVMRNTAGDLTLCGDCALMQGVWLTMQDQNMQTYTVNGCDFVGGRPPVTR